jgi:magnesium transporter
MRHEVVEQEGFRWVDVVGPDREELLALAHEFELPQTVVEDCLDPEHLPKHEKLGDATFLILRLWDRAGVEDAFTVQELTRKLSIFYRESFLLTVHRVDLEEVGGVRESCSNGVPQEGMLSWLLTLLINRTLDSYERPLAEGEATADLFETAVFDGDRPPSLREAHNLKRRVSLIRRILYQTSTVLQKIVPSAERSASLFQDTRESADAYLFWADQSCR